MLITCFACSISVDRKDCHKNRYDEYICRKCQSAGVKITLRRRLLNLKKKLQKLEFMFWRLLLWSGLAVSILLMLFRMFESVGNTT